MIWDWGRRGGGPIVALQLARRLIEQGYGDRIALSLSEQNELIGEFRQLGAPLSTVHTFAGEPSLGRLVRSAASLVRGFRKHLARHRPATILVPMLFGAALPLAPLARRAVSRFVYVVHDVRPHPGETIWLELRVGQTGLLCLADRLVTLSQAMRSELVALHPRLGGRIVVEPLAGLYDRLHAPRSFPEGRRVRFLVAGRQVRYKGFERLAAALRLLDPTDFDVTIAGDGPERPRIKALFGGAPNVTLSPGWASPADHRRQFEAHDVQLCPYDEGSQSGLICDALTMAMPTVVTPVGALPEQIGFGRAGWITADMTPPALAEVISKVARGEGDYAPRSQACGTIIDEQRAVSTWPRVLGLAQE
jgi:glycosyltransferase involved in cell wall biosynthesis